MDTVTSNLVINRGDSYRFRANLTVKLPDYCIAEDCSIVPMNLDGITVTAMIKSSYNACEGWPMEVSVGDPALGIVDIFLPANESQLLRADKAYVWDLRVANLDTNEAYTAFRGSLTVLDTTAGF